MSILPPSVKQVLKRICSAPESLHRAMEVWLGANYPMPFMLRMLFSALVDADYLDTEAFMKKEDAALREQLANSTPDWALLLRKLNCRLSGFDTTGTINSARNQFMRQCKTHGSRTKAAIYSLFLPTGAGKTLSSMTWALEAAKTNGASRIIYVIPYTSIITQTASIFNSIFGEEHVLAHHSEIDFHNDEDKYNRWKLLSDNWNAPIIVTTSVQFFESLHSNRPGKCRKLHNLADAIIIFDEVQLFPTSFLNPIVRCIEALNKYCHTTLLMCTATPPTLYGNFEAKGRQSSKFYGLPARVEEVVPYNAQLFSVFDRVQYNLALLKLTYKELAQKLSVVPSALCIVNTRTDAKKLYDAIMEERREAGEVFHLSRMMCSAHIKQHIQTIRERLQLRLPTLVVSTQLIEAGVDIDFPVVYRADCGLDRIIQAGGRCNREGKYRVGELYRFELVDGSKPYGEQKLAIQATANTLYKLGTMHINPNDPEVITMYYGEYFGNQVTSFDKSGIEEKLWEWGSDYNEPEDYLGKIGFESASDEFKMIDEKGQEDVFVAYDKLGSDLMMSLAKGEINTRLQFRQLQRYKVSISTSNFKKLQAQGVINAYRLGDKALYYVPKTFQEDVYERKVYSADTGIVCENIFDEQTLIS